jgi:hypothetical protein
VMVRVAVVRVVVPAALRVVAALAAVEINNLKSPYTKNSPVSRGVFLFNLKFFIVPKPY